jgi:hypothetical protein
MKSLLTHYMETQNPILSHRPHLILSATSHLCQSSHSHEGTLLTLTLQKPYAAVNPQEGNPLIAPSPSPL